MIRKEHLQKVAESTHQNLAKKNREFRLEQHLRSLKRKKEEGKPMLFETRSKIEKYPISDEEKKMISDLVSNEHQNDFAAKHPILGDALLGIPELIHIRRLSNALAERTGHKQLPYLKSFA